MRLIRHSLVLRCFFLLVISVAYAGCNLNEKATPAQIQQQTSVESEPDSPNRIWSAPELQTRKFRFQFYGYDTLYYRLVAVEADHASRDILYRLVIEANYGSKEPRHYDMARFQNGIVVPTSNLRHEAMRCQLFGTMADACLYRDRAEIVLDAADLQAARQNGLTVTLASPQVNYESLNLSPEYVEGFLLAVLKP